MKTSKKVDNKTSQIETVPWHALEVESVFLELATSASGLTSQEVDLRTKKYGKNLLPSRKPKGLVVLLFSQFKSPLIYVLVIAAVVSGAIGELTDAGFIFAVLILNALIGGFQEWKAEKGSYALQQLIRVITRVQRGGEVYEIPAEDLVPGDLVWLESGMRVPADLRIISSNGLEIDESLLTGESTSVQKFSTALDKKVNFAERSSMTFAGSLVTRGRANGIVVEIGSATEVGRLARNVQSMETGKPPLLVRMERFVKVITVSVFLVAGLLALYSFFFKNASVSEVFMFSVALAVSAIPEGLPIAMTAALAIATSKMAKKKVIVRKLAAVEGLGSCTMIATDKTGTLTCNAMTVREIHNLSGRQYIISGEGYTPEGTVSVNGVVIDPKIDIQLEKVATIASLCNEADLHKKDEKWIWHGDPVDIAFLSAAYKLGHTRPELLSRYKLLASIPFESEIGYTASFHSYEAKTHVFVKGSPEKVFLMANLTQGELQVAEECLDSMAKRGLRVLALAEGIDDRFHDSSEPPPSPTNLRIIALVGMIDPPRPGVLESIESCHKSGIHVAMVTGDHRTTATAIARELKILKPSSKVVTGAELDEMSEANLVRDVASISVFARVAPAQKLRIVNAARNSNQFVAVTGDGINDAPALKAANVGIAMGLSGTDVAKEAAELVISDDNFSSIVAGIEEGRIAYDNIRKVIYLLISTGAAELVLVSLAILSGLPIPLLPVQLLWLNLVTNGIQDVALAFEPGEDDILSRPPRPARERIFNRLMIERTLVAAFVMGTLGFACFVWFIQNGYSEFDARNLTLLLMVLFENVHIGNCRSETKSAFKLSPLKSPILLAGTAAAFLIHLGAMSFEPLQKILSVKPTSIREFITILCVALILLFIMEIHKLIWKKRNKTPIAKSA